MQQRTFLFRLSEDERQRLAELSEVTGLAQGEVLRRLLRKAAIVPTLGLSDDHELVHGSKG